MSCSPSWCSREQTSDQLSACGGRSLSKDVSRGLRQGDGVSRRAIGGLVAGELLYCVGRLCVNLCSEDAVAFLAAVHAFPRLPAAPPRGCDGEAEDVRQFVARATAPQT